jgi:hypothetical protein
LLSVFENNPGMIYKALAKALAKGNIYAYPARKWFSTYEGW